MMIDNYTYSTTMKLIEKAQKKYTFDELISSVKKSLMPIDALSVYTHVGKDHNLIATVTVDPSSSTSKNDIIAMANMMLKFIAESIDGDFNLPTDFSGFYIYNRYPGLDFRLKTQTMLFGGTIIDFIAFIIGYILDIQHQHKINMLKQPDFLQILAVNNINIRKGSENNEN